MSHSLIINARAQLHWQRRLVSDATTAAAWGFWLWLWRPVVSTLSWLFGARLGLQQTALKLLSVGAPITVADTVMALFGTSGALLLWNRLAVRKQQPASAINPAEYARHFGIAEQDVQRTRESQICTVHHDDQGRIVELEIPG
jgi:poly-beta-1,6-N-acetyl-D-glucosamine biosynthesis protein PgaD